MTALPNSAWRFPKSFTGCAAPCHGFTKEETSLFREQIKCRAGHRGDAGLDRRLGHRCEFVRMERGQRRAFLLALCDRGRRHRAETKHADRDPFRRPSVTTEVFSTHLGVDRFHVVLAEPRRERATYASRQRRIVECRGRELCLGRCDDRHAVLRYAGRYRFTEADTPYRGER